MRTQEEQPCPPTPSPVKEAAVDAVASHRAASAAAEARDRAEDDGDSHRRLAATYFNRLTEVARDEKRLCEMMRAFGRYLYRQDVRPEHIVICAREATAHMRFREQALVRTLSQQAVGWTIEGYYMERGTPAP
jgi:hypothetical protein